MLHKPYYVHMNSSLSMWQAWIGASHIFVAKQGKSIDYGVAWPVVVGPFDMTCADNGHLKEFSKVIFSLRNATWPSSSTKN